MQSHGQLSLPIPFEFVAMTGELSHLFQVCSGSEIRKTLCNTPETVLTIVFLQVAPAVYEIMELIGCE